MNNIALLVFPEGHSREDVYQKRKPAQDREVAKLLDELESEVSLFIPSQKEIRDRTDLLGAIKEIHGQDIDGCLIYIPTFTSASEVGMALRLIHRPCAIMGNDAHDTVSKVGFFAATGAARQAGLNFRKIVGDISDKSVKADLLSFFRAATAEKRLLGQTYGLFGGRALGISTGTADSAQWLKIFGVDTHHLDQYEIIHAAEVIEVQRVNTYKEWMSQNYGALCFQPGRFEDEHFSRMIRSYLAVKDLAKEYKLDFVGIKCQPELSNGYVVQCLAVQLLGDPYDAEGPKEPMVCSCEADADGALTMQIMKYISGGMPTALQDIYSYDDHILVLANCGSNPSYFSKRSKEAKENLSQVYLQPHDFGQAGGASTQFNFAPGVCTYARLIRNDLSYKMVITKGEVLEQKREDLYKYSWFRPTSVVKMGVDYRRFGNYFDCNHVHCGYRDYVQELVEFCILKNIDYELLE